MGRQSEWIILRRMCAFLRSRDLKATARTLEQESGIKVDRPHVRGLLRRGRWRSADKYVSAFLGDVRTPAAHDKFMGNTCPAQPLPAYE